MKPIYTFHDLYKSFVRLFKHTHRTSTNEISTEDNVVLGANLEVDGKIKSLENIVDTNGRDRFIEGNIEVLSKNFSLTYGKWSLCGTHLMFVIYGSYPTAEITNDKIFNFTLPAYIYDKIKTIRNDTKLIYVANYSGVVSPNYNPFSQLARIYKEKNNTIEVVLNNQDEMEGNTNFIRIQFDLVIDTD